MINPSSSAFVSEQMMDPKPQKKQNRNKNKKPPCFSRTLPRTPLSSPNFRTPRSGATLLRRARARARKNSRGFLFRPSFLRFRSFPVETGIPTYLSTYLPTYIPTYLPTYVPPHHAYCTLFRWFLLFRMKKWTQQGRNPLFSCTYHLTYYYSCSAQIISSTQINSWTALPTPTPKKNQK
jgi:hypothetical protein